MTRKKQPTHILDKNVYTDSLHSIYDGFLFRRQVQANQRTISTNLREKKNYENTYEEKLTQNHLL